MENGDKTKIIEVLLNVIKENTAELKAITEQIKLFFQEQKTLDLISGKTLDGVLNKINRVEEDIDTIKITVAEIRKQIERKNLFLEIVVAILSMTIVILSIIKYVKFGG
jgi:uncharacterized protein Yka (UPF0111/DUF47 family)